MTRGGRPPAPPNAGSPGARPGFYYSPPPFTRPAASSIPCAPGRSPPPAPPSPDATSASGESPPTSSTACPCRGSRYQIREGSVPGRSSRWRPCGSPSGLAAGWPSRPSSRAWSSNGWAPPGTRRSSPDAAAGSGSRRACAFRTAGSSSGTAARSSMGSNSTACGGPSISAAREPPSRSRPNLRTMNPCWYRDRWTGRDSSPGR